MDDALIEKANLRCDFLGKTHFMGGQQHGHALLGQIAHDIENLRHQFRIECGSDFIERKVQKSRIFFLLN